jgi:hypothetical protein
VHALSALQSSKNAVLSDDSKKITLLFSYSQLGIINSLFLALQAFPNSKEYACLLSLMLIPPLLESHALTRRFIPKILLNQVGETSFSYLLLL